MLLGKIFNIVRATIFICLLLVGLYLNTGICPFICQKTCLYSKAFVGSRSLSLFNCTKYVAPVPQSVFGQMCYCGDIMHRIRKVITHKDANMCNRIWFRTCIYHFVKHQVFVIFTSLSSPLHLTTLATTVS